MFLLLGVILLTNCATNVSQQGMRIDNAIDIVVKDIRENIPQGKVAAILGFISESDPISEYVVNELTVKLTNSKSIQISERNPRALELIRNELQFQLSGEVSDESAKRIGAMTGAEYAITGSLKEFGNEYIFIIRVINVESALLESATRKNINKNDPRTRVLLNNKPMPREKLVAISLDNPTISKPTSTEKKEPVWLRNPDVLYDVRSCIAAVGHGTNLEQAVSKAKDNMIAIFGMSNRMDYIIGAEIKESWTDLNGTFYALAVLDKKLLIEQYNRILNENAKLIQELETMPSNRINTIDGYARYREIARIARANEDYVRLIYFAGEAPMLRDLKSESQYLTDASNILKNISIELTSENDRSGRIRNAFFSGINQLGLQSGNNSPYLMRINTNVGNNQNYNIEMNLIEKNTDNVLYKYSIIENGNDENRVISALEVKIREDFGKKFGDFLNSYIPNF